MADDDDAPWPAEGTTLSEALRRIVDRPAVDRLDPALLRFFAIMSQGDRYRATGRRGSPDAKRTEIPPDLWPRTSIQVEYAESIVEPGPPVQGRPSYVTWYDVRIFAIEPPASQPVASETAPEPIVAEPATGVAPKRSRKKSVSQQPQQKRAWKVLRRIFPDGCPTSEEMPNNQLLAKFYEEWDTIEGKDKEENEYKPSSNTVLRAIGRL
jgi:hypothetical protein